MHCYLRETPLQRTASGILYCPNPDCPDCKGADGAERRAVAAAITAMRSLWRAIRQT